MNSNEIINLFKKYKESVNKTLYLLNHNKVTEENCTILDLIEFNSNLENKILSSLNNNNILFILYDNLTDSIGDENYEKSELITNFINNGNFDLNKLKLIDYSMYLEILIQEESI